MATRYVDTNLDMFGNTISNAVIEGYYTSGEVDAKLASFKGFEFKVVDALPATGESNTIYLIPSASAKAKNVKDEYIWTEGDWEQIGSTSFKLDLVQNAEGITVNNVPLQDADETQDGLMTKAMVSELRGKQDVLKAGANITIENGVISSTGGGGGSGGGHSSYVGEFAGDGQTEYTITHGLDTYNIIFQIRTVDTPVRYVFADVEAPDRDSLKITFFQPQTQKLSISVMASDRIVAPTPTPPTPSTFDIEVHEVSTPSNMWSIVNPTEKPLYIQAYDSTGNEIGGDVRQESSTQFTPVIMNLLKAESGNMFAAAATAVVEFTDQAQVDIDYTTIDGLTAADWCLIQIVCDGDGELDGDVHQSGGSASITFARPVSGRVVLRKCTEYRSFSIDGANSFTYQHNLGRTVGVQTFMPTSGQGGLDIVLVDENTVRVSSNVTVSGILLIA